MHTQAHRLAAMIAMPPRQCRRGDFGARHKAYHGRMALLPTFTTLGHGPPVLLLHGSGGGFRSFAPQVETLASLGFRAIAWDMPGYGQSPPIEPYGFKDLAESCVALIEALAPLTGGAPVALLGQGLGGMVAQEVVLRRPDLIHQLVLVATAASVAPDDAYGRHAAQMLAWLEAGHDMARIAALRLPRLMGRGALPAGVQLATHCQARVHGATWRRALQALAGFERRAALPQLAVPTLLVAGGQDRLTPPAVLREMAAQVSGARHEVLADAGHLPPLERPDEFDQLLLPFLRHARAWRH